MTERYTKSNMMKITVTVVTTIFTTVLSAFWFVSAACTAGPVT